MADLTLAQAEMFHVALSDACAHVALGARYQGALGLTISQGARPFAEAGIWDINLPPDDSLEEAPDLDRMGKRLFRLSLDAASAGAGADRMANVKIAGENFTIYVFAIHGGGSFKDVWADVGVDTDRFLSTLIATLA